MDLFDCGDDVFEHSIIHRHFDPLFFDFFRFTNCSNMGSRSHLRLESPHTAHREAAE